MECKAAGWPIYAASINFRAYLHIEYSVLQHVGCSGVLYPVGCLCITLMRH